MAQTVWGAYNGEKRAKGVALRAATPAGWQSREATTHPGEESRDTRGWAI